MPLNGHAHLVAQGWSGSGTGLRQGAIIRPIAIPQKRTLAGIGKDRDEAFPFWDHLFNAAANSIQIKLHKDSDDSDSSTDNETTSALPAFSKTSTGLISNKRPLLGTPALSGTSTPDDTSTNASTSGIRLSLLATAKREAAKRNLYSRFYRGLTLAPDLVIEVDLEEENIASTSTISIPAGLDASDQDEVSSISRAEKKRKEKRKRDFKGKEKAKEIPDSGKGDKCEPEKKQKKRKDGEETRKLKRRKATKVDGLDDEKSVERKGKRKQEELEELEDVEEGVAHDGDEPRPKKKRKRRERSHAEEAKISKENRKEKKDEKRDKKEKRHKRKANKVDDDTGRSSA